MSRSMLLVLVSLLTAVRAQDCYNSTLLLLVAQAFDPRPNDVQKTYSFCPDQTIQIGIPSDATFTDFVNGDFPLGVIRPNVTIEGNGVTLVGGVYQMVTLPVFAYNGLVFADAKEGVFVNDVIFQGPLAPVPGFASNSIFLSGPGDVTFSNIVVQDLDFTDGVCGSNAVTLGASALPGLEALTPPGSIQATFQYSIFQDSKTSNCTSIMWTDNQGLTLSNVVVDNIDTKAVVETSGNEAQVVLDNVCIDNANFSAAVFRMNEYGNETVFVEVSGLYVGDDVEQEECMNGDDNLSLNQVVGDGEYDCTSLATVNSCTVGVVTMAPTGMPTMDPMSMPSMTPKPTATPASPSPTPEETESPTETPSSGYGVVSLTALYTTVGAGIMVFMTSWW